MENSTPEKSNFKEIEAKWQKKWGEKNIYSADDNSSKSKKYILVEFPYPSGEGLHIGHAFTMTGADIHARFNRMKGNEVLFPIGFDAFGLPTENYAIKNQVRPQDATESNVANFIRQMKMLGFSFDWDRTFNTTDPDYYKWTQWIFIQLFKKGLAYKKEMPINWCPSCKTGLANEEVIDGKCERCGAETSRRNLSQWVLKITEYADRLSDELDLTDYPEHVIAAQRNWIGKTEGINIHYPLESEDGKTQTDLMISCYSTRPDTNFGATFVVIAPENKLALDITTSEYQDDVKDYIEESKKKSERERIADYSAKTGVFTGRYCINRLTGKRMPIWVADFVVASAGTGIVVGVPAHDERDFDFAKSHEIEIIPVIQPSETWDFDKKPYTEINDGSVINSDFLNGENPRDAKEHIITYLVEKGWGDRSKNYHIRDWIFSRQHYWGEPIPMVNCEKCGWVPVPEDQLPITLPEVEHYEPTDTGESPLASMTDWVETTCPVCGGQAKRETDTMPNWAGSSWYFLRYCDPKNSESLAASSLLKRWMPVDVYVGGSEHTTLHLLYSRFWHKFLNDINVAPSKEPYIKRVEHGVILGPDGKRMSKSRGNVIIPDKVAEEYGVDATRAYLMFMGPFTGTMAWNENAFMGVKRFLDRYSSFITLHAKNVSAKDNSKVVIEINKAMKIVERGYGNFQYNTSIAALMKMLNNIETEEKVSHKSLIQMTKMMAPLTPYLAEELWQVLGESYSIHSEAWPEYDKTLLSNQDVEIGVQVNGKFRGTITINKDNTEEQVKEIALKNPNIAKAIGNSEIKKTIYVPLKIVNIIV